MPPNPDPKTLTVAPQGLESITVTTTKDRHTGALEFSPAAFPDMETMKSNNKNDRKLVPLLHRVTGKYWSN